MPKIKPAEEIPLVPFETFRKVAKRIVSNSKEESDKQLALFQLTNSKKREAKKKR